MKRPLLAQDGRTVLHPCITQAGARRWLMKNLGDVTLITKHKFTLSVFARDPMIRDLYGARDGWMYSIGK